MTIDKKATFYMKDVPKVMPFIYFHSKYNSGMEQNNTVEKRKFSDMKHIFFHQVKPIGSTFTTRF